MATVTYTTTYEEIRMRDNVFVAHPLGMAHGGGERPTEKEHLQAIMFEVVDKLMGRRYVLK